MFTVYRFIVMFPLFSAYSQRFIHFVVFVCVHVCVTKNVCLHIQAHTHTHTEHVHRSWLSSSDTARCMSQVHQTGRTKLNMVMHSVVNAEHQYPSILMHQFMIAIIQKFVLVEGQCILGYLNFDYLNPCLSELTKLVNFLEFHYNLQGGGHLVMHVICISTTRMLLVLRVHLMKFMLVLMLEVQKGCNIDSYLYLG